MDNIEKFLSDVEALSPERAHLINHLRTIFKSINADLHEDIKYGGVVYNSDTELLGGIYSYKDHISIEFSHGADFSDPGGLLEGKGKRRRHIKIRFEADITAKKAFNFIEQALSR